MEETLIGNKYPTVFISHDSRDHNIADAFSNLLTGVSLGMIKTFFSTDKKSMNGIEYGAEWYPKIILELEKALNIVCLFTENSLNRPWILYEAGVAKGNSLKKNVFGISVGISKDRINNGPFAQFQNCSDDQHSLYWLVFHLLKQIPGIEPPEDSINLHVSEFIRKKELILSGRKDEIAIEKLSKLSQCEFILSNKEYNLLLDCSEHKNKPWRVQCWEPHYGKNQRWIINRLDMKTAVISSAESLLCLDTPEGDKVHLWRFHGELNQQWVISLLEDYSFKIESKKNGWCLDAWREPGQESTIVHLHPWHGKDNQRWWINPWFSK